ncbi:MAG: TIR domain-containing protein [Acutalibacteraceae bacterium]|nr:TIR domain-containing protein [Acutalibacteraceae bacterium]
MKIFISWSGNKSKETAKTLKKWIPLIIQNTQPYFSSTDIDKGVRWSKDIANELQDTSFGILCVTKENLASAWLNFEAGALSKSIETSKVCPLLIDLKPSDIINNSPLLQFQMTNITKDDIFKLFESINSNLGDSKIDDSILNHTFTSFWPEMEKELKSVISERKASNEETVLSPIEEILDLIRYQHKLLTSPEKLLPANYIYDILSQNVVHLPKDVLIDIEDQLHKINMTISNILESPIIKNPHELKSSELASLYIEQNQDYLNNILYIRNITTNMGMILRKYQKNLNYYI